MTLSNAVIHGSRHGDWNTTPRSGPGPGISLSSTSTPPSVDGSNPAAIDSTVDFPQPEWPIRQTNSPLPIAKSKSRTITASPPSGFGYTFVRCEISRYLASLLTRPPRCVGRRRRRRRRRIGRIRQGDGGGGQCSTTTPSPWSQQILDDLIAHRLEAGVVVHRLAIARPRDRHRDRRPERRRRTDRQRDDPVGEQQRLVDVVGDQHDRLLARLPDARDLVLQHGARQRVQRRQRLVHQQHLGIDGQRARERHALAHAARQLGRALVARRRQVHQRQVLLRVRALLVARPVAEPLVDGQVDVLVRGQPRQQRVVLEHDAAIGARPADRLAAELDRPAIGRGQPRHQADQRRLARARVADDADQLAALDREVDVRQHLACAPSPFP